MKPQPSMHEALDTSTSPASGAQPELSPLLITLLKGVIYREGDERLWGNLLSLQARVRDQMGLLGLDLVLDEAEGYAFLRGKPEPDAADTTPAIPRLVARRPLSFPVSLLLALLRKKLAEFDAGGGQEGSRLILTREDIVELLRVFLRDSANEARLVDQIETHINKVTDLGFLRRLKPASGASGQANYEVRRIIKAFVDAQWLAEFDARLAGYQRQLQGEVDPPDE